MLQDAKKAMAPWINGQPIYAPISSRGSSNGVPILHSGEGNKCTVRCGEHNGIQNNVNTAFMLQTFCIVHEVCNTLGWSCFVLDSILSVL